MTQPPQLCTVDTTLALASQRMSSTGAGTMIVLNRHGRIAGILTDRDLALAVGTLEGAVATATVGSVMTCGAHVCAPDDEVREAVARMARAKVRRLPVVAPDGDVKGLISIDDVLLWGLAPVASRPATCWLLCGPSAQLIGRSSRAGEFWRTSRNTVSPPEHSGRRNGWR